MTYSDARFYNQQEDIRFKSRTVFQNLKILRNFQLLERLIKLKSHTLLIATIYSMKYTIENAKAFADSLQWLRNNLRGIYNRERKYHVFFL